jgi:toxin CcdB
MAQFDVHRNPGRNRASVPYVVVLQSRRFDSYGLRLVAPLVLPTTRVAYPDIAPRFEVEGREVVLDPLQLQSVPRGSLGPAIASLADIDTALRIIHAIDDVISRSHG